MTTFECLPNEVLLETFLYCYPKDLFISLFNLNQRLNALIYSQPVNIYLGNGTLKHSLNDYYKSVLFHARKQIHTLELSDTYERMSDFLVNDSRIPVDFETRKAMLSQVNSLILVDPKPSSLNQILQYTNNIEYLRIAMVYRRHSPTDYDQELFKYLFAKTSLKHLCLKLYYTLVFVDDIGTSTSLRHLILFNCLITDVARLLRRTPNLEKLHVICKNPANMFSNDNDHFNYSIYDGLAECIPHLTELNMRTSHIPFEEMEFFLLQLPQLIKLTLSSLRMENYSNGANWERLIINHLPNLQKFNLFISESYFPADSHIDLNEIIQSFNTFFWHRWPIVIEFYTGSTDNKHFTLYTLPIQKNVLYTYLYGVQIRTNIDGHDSNMTKSYYHKVEKLDFTFHDNTSPRSPLPERIYSHLETLSFSFKSLNTRSYPTDGILIDLQHTLSADALAQIKRIYLYDQIYPTNFVCNLLKLLPNIVRLYTPSSALDLVVPAPRIKYLTITVHSTTELDSTNVLRQMATRFPNLLSLYFELTNNADIYILLPYCLRKFPNLSDLNVTIDELSPCIDRQGLVLWFDDYKKLNGLNDDVQIEFNDDNHRFQVEL